MVTGASAGRYYEDFQVADHDRPPRGRTIGEAGTAHDKGYVPVGENGESSA